MAPTDPLALVGTTLAEKYAIESVAGTGGYGIVYRAMHLIWKRPVAIKVFKALAGFGQDEHQKLLDGFIEEGRLLADLSERTAAICQARDVGVLTTNRGQRVPYMVLEWLEGETFEHVLAREKKQGFPLRSIDEVVHLLGPAADALSIAHRQKVAHRDIKPGNIFIIGDPRGECSVKLLDFGIAKVVSDAQKEGGGFAETSGAVTSFTPAYGAPEQFTRTHGATGPWTDVFAFALVIVEAMVGSEPLAGETFMQVAYAAADIQRRPTPRTLGANVSDAVESVFLRALAVKPMDRFQSAGDFWNALRESVGLEPVRSMQGSGRTNPNPQFSARNPQIQPQYPQQVPLATASQPGGFGGHGPTLANPITGSAPGFTTTAPKKGAGVAIGLGVLAAVVVVGAGAGLFVMSKRAAKPIAAASASVASSAIASASAAPVPTCPAGMIQIPGGKFFMGSDDPADLPMERPAHNVTLAPFCIDEFEVTTKRYLACSDSGGCRRAGDTNEWEGISDKERKAFDPLCNIRDPDGHGDHPINCVTWQMATEFCTSQGGRLPTEAEWEFAARGPDGRKYPWGDDPPTTQHLNACGKECMAWGKKNHIDEIAMYDGDDGYANTAPVGKFPAGKSRYGVQDVVGNVWEWTADWYAPYTADAETDPQGPASGTERVIRGGAWNGGYPAWVRPTFRYKQEPTQKSYGIGFRCAKSL